MNRRHTTDRSAKHQSVFGRFCSDFLVQKTVSRRVDPRKQEIRLRDQSDYDEPVAVRHREETVASGQVNFLHAAAETKAK